MTIDNIQVISVPVADQELAKRFYVDTLGLELLEDRSAEGMRWVMVAPKGANTALTLVTWFESMPSGSLRGLVLRSDDVNADYERLLDAGVTFDQPPTAQPWGTEAVLRDADGNCLVLLQPST